jgi:hypothetical protein
MTNGEKAGTINLDTALSALGTDQSLYIIMIMVTRSIVLSTFSISSTFLYQHQFVSIV